MPVSRRNVLIGGGLLALGGVLEGDAVIRRLLMAAGGGGGFAGLMGAFEYVQVYRAGSLTIPGNGTSPSGVDVTFTSATHDPLGYWDSATKLVVPAGKGGVPFLVWGVTFSNDMPAVDGNFQPKLNNGAIQAAVFTFIKNASQAGGYGLGWFSSPPAIISPADGDDIRLNIWQDGGIGNTSITVLYTTLNLLRLVA